LTELFLVCLAERRARFACGTSAESKHPEDVSLKILFQGVLSKLLLKSFISMDKKREAASVEFPDAAWKRRQFSGSFDSSPVASSLGLAQEDRDKNFLSNSKHYMFRYFLVGENKVK
jgi:hypothetical protein